LRINFVATKVGLEIWVAFQVCESESQGYAFLGKTDDGGPPFAEAYKCELRVEREQEHRCREPTEGVNH
jgi:hypothetical protein